MESTHWSAIGFLPAGGRGSVDRQEMCPAHLADSSSGVPAMSPCSRGYSQWSGSPGPRLPGHRRDPRQSCPWVVQWHLRVGGDAPPTTCSPGSRHSAGWSARTTGLCRDDTVKMGSRASCSRLWGCVVPAGSTTNRTGRVGRTEAGGGGGEEEGGVREGVEKEEGGEEGGKDREDECEPTSDPRHCCPPRCR